MLRKWLAHPYTRGLDVDDPRLTHIRRKIISEKSFLRQIYQEWYRAIADSLPVGEDPILEIGSGAGFLQEFIPDLVRSEVFGCPGIDVILDAMTLPFAAGSLRAILMTDVLHHLPEPRRFFSEASRCVRAGGVITMIEPWVSPWSRWVYAHLHHEPFHPEATDWSFPATGPLSGANGALPWILFERDRTLFEREFPEWTIRTIKPQMPFLYLISGGISIRSLMPGETFGIWRGLESILQPFMKYAAMFSFIVLQRKNKIIS
jgi:SAM-dependent methyltransferase